MKAYWKKNLLVDHGRGHEHHQQCGFDDPEDPIDYLFDLTMPQGVDELGEAEVQ